MRTEDRNGDETLSLPFLLYLLSKHRNGNHLMNDDILFKYEAFEGSSMKDTHFE